MMLNTKYSCIEFNGGLLNPSFSIYLFEIIKAKDETYFYVGMTGDNHYPSARSILHRLGGHIDLSKKSTQSQFIIAIKALFKKRKEDHLSPEQLSSLTIKLHHWPVDGFVKWDGDMRTIDKTIPQYQTYIDIRNRVAALENKIIYDFTGRYLLNKTAGNSNAFLNDAELNIYNAVEKIIKHKSATLKN